MFLLQATGRVTTEGPGHEETFDSNHFIFPMGLQAQTKGQHNSALRVTDKEMGGCECTCSDPFCILDELLKLSTSATTLQGVQECEGGCMVDDKGN